ncbi:hypothetical protein, partial [Paenibacillus prosopidis]
CLFSLMSDTSSVPYCLLSSASNEVSTFHASINIGVMAASQPSLPNITEKMGVKAGKRTYALVN